MKTKDRIKAVSAQLSPNGVAVANLIAATLFDCDLAAPYRPNRDTPLTCAQSLIVTHFTTNVTLYYNVSMKHLRIDIDDTLHQQLKLLAAAHNSTMAELIRGKLDELTQFPDGMDKFLEARATGHVFARYNKGKKPRGDTK